MKYYVCVENDRVVSIIDYVPNVPESVQVYEIAPHQYEAITNKTHYFDCHLKEVQPVAQAVLDRIASGEKLNFLQSTDWMILRHLREKMLSVETSLSEQQYIALEKERQEAAKSIVK